MSALKKIETANRARELWGPAFDDIPKSVFAIVAWNVLQGSGIATHEEAERLFADSVRRLTDGGLLPLEAGRQAIEALTTKGGTTA